jgi:type I restriction enzyme S subunit
MTSKAVHEWIPTKLGDIIKIKHGFAFKGEFFSETPTDNILVTPGNFNIGGGFKDSKFKYYAGEIPQEYILNVGDVIVTMTDLSKAGDTLGYSAKVPSIEGKKLLHNQRIGLLQFTNNKVNQDFIYWLLRTKNYQNLILGSATGSTVKHTSPNRICEFEFELPSLYEQERIANILSSLDDKIALNREMNKTLEAMAQAIFKSWFVDFEPFKEGEFVESELGMIPRGWSVKKLAEFTKVITGKTPPTKESINYGNKYPFITIPDMHGEVFITKTDRALSELGHNVQKNKLLPKNSILVSCIATVGLVAINSEESHTNQQINSIVCASNETFYIYMTMQNMKDTLTEMGGGGTATLNVNKGIFEKIQILVPTKENLNRFDSKVRAIFEKILENQKQIETLSTLRDTLLPKLLSGEMAV